VRLSNLASFPRFPYGMQRMGTRLEREAVALATPRIVISALA